MLGQPASILTVLAAERHARFAAEADDARWRRQRRQPHPAPPCAGLATQLPPVVIDLAGDGAAATEPTAAR